MNPRASSGLPLPEQAPGNPPDPNDQIVRAGQIIDFACSATTQKPLVRRSPALAGRSRIDRFCLALLLDFLIARHTFTPALPL
ncbi:hypothetical protein HYZ99_00170 [Candidatus Peregrinibacteria bacterium]|nr:hypothetical protein [Candidatus Peregrinibacteria bacterium]